jgi:uncharacterized protein YbaP (TraB family)
MLQGRFTGKSKRASTLSRRLAVALVLVTVGCASPLPPPERPDIPFGEGRIWQIERAGQPTSWAFGTIHVTDPRVFDLPAAADTAFEDSDIAVFEVDYRRRSSREELNEIFYLPEGQSLRDVVGFDTYRDMQRLMRTEGMYWYGYHRRQPWVAWMALSNREILVDLQSDSERPVLDDWLLLQARKAGKEVTFLETDVEQWRVLSGIPMDHQVSMLRSTIDTYYSARTRVETVNIYLAGDLAMRYALWRRSLSHMKPAAAETYHRRLISDRNRLMVERALPMMAKASVFLAVGAIHMPGEDGILQLLVDRGFTVTRLE